MGTEFATVEEGRRLRHLDPVPFLIFTPRPLAPSHEGRAVEPLGNGTAREEQVMSRVALTLSDTPCFYRRLNMPTSVSCCSLCGLEASFGHMTSHRVREQQ